jgi:DNA-binding GntR family transcriptional regulator
LPSRLPYQGIVDELRASIRQGRLVGGERLPLENELAERYRRSHPTVRRAITPLKAEGLVNTEQGPRAVAARGRVVAADKHRFRYGVRMR